MTMDWRRFKSPFLTLKKRSTLFAIQHQTLDVFASIWVIQIRLIRLP